ncbi:MAG: HEAT repeat domain-containing protein [Desulfobulbaceae bacterium]|nr:HEAT repeat domain-containing protein [Desulfobulbaceae bacterium]
MFKGRKIRKLLEQYNAVGSPEGDKERFTELGDYGHSVIPYVIEAFQQRKLTSQKAATLLDKVCDDSCLKIMLPLLGDPYDEVRRVAKEMIIARWRKTASVHLIEYLDESDIYLRNNAVELLSLFRDAACESTLISMFNGAKPDLKKTIIKIVSNFGTTAGTRLSISALNDPDWQVCVAAVKCLGGIKAQESVEPLMEKLHDNELQVKRYALDALIAIADKRTMPLMLELLKDDDMLIRQKAMDCLINIGDSTVVSDLVKLLRDDDVNVRRSSIEVLRNLKDPKVTSALIKAIKDSDWWVRQIATDTLTELEDDNISRSFIRMCADKDENIRRCAVEFFNNMTTPLAFDALIGLLHDPDWWVRAKAATALGRLGDKRAVPPLLEMAKDGEINRVIPKVLVAIDETEAVGYLRRFLAGGMKLLKIASMRALAKLKDIESLEALKKLLGDPDEDVRNEAVSALKTMTGKIFKPAAVEPSGQVRLQELLAPGTTVAEAIVVIDVCNSTDITSRYGDAHALKLMHKLSSVVSPVAKREGALFNKGTGDGHLITFPKVENAVRFSTDVLHEMETVNKQEEESGRINLRFAIHFGEAKVDENGDRLGAAISMTFRVEGVKPEGLIDLEGGMQPDEMPLDNRIFITENIEKEIREMEGLNARVVGLFELKGITGLHRIFQLTR